MKPNGSRDVSIHTRKGLQVNWPFKWFCFCFFFCCGQFIPLCLLLRFYLLSTCCQVECYDYDNDGSHDLIGTFEATMTRLAEASRTSPVWICLLFSFVALTCGSQFGDNSPQGLTCCAVLSSGRVWVHQQQKEAEEKGIQELGRCEREAMPGVVLGFCCFGVCVALGTCTALTLYVL